MSRRATVELGTLLTVVAGVLAAAGGAALFMNGALGLREKGSEAAGGAANQEGAYGLRILEVSTERTAHGYSLIQQLVTAPAGTQVDLRNVVLTIRSGELDVQARYDPAGGAGKFTFQAIRDADRSLAGSAPKVDSNDLVRLTIDLGTASLAPGRSVVIGQTGAQGSSTEAALNLYVPLDPTATLLNLK
jgi:archaellin